MKVNHIYQSLAGGMLREEDFIDLPHREARAQAEADDQQAFEKPVETTDTFGHRLASETEGGWGE